MTTYGIGEFRMRNGGKAVVTRDDGDGRWPLEGFAEEKDGFWIEMSWSTSGLECDGEFGGYDLVAPLVEPAPNPVDTEMLAWLADVEAGFEGTTPGDWTARNHNQQEQLGGYNDKYVAIDVDGNTHRSLVEDLIAPDADHIARTNPKRMAALIGWLKEKGVMK